MTGKIEIRWLAYVGSDISPEDVVWKESCNSVAQAEEAIGRLERYMNDVETLPELDDNDF